MTDGFALLLGHLVGDYIFQNDWQARNKKTDARACALHALLYCCAIAFFTAWPWWALGLTFICHFIQDRTNIIAELMDANGQKDFRTGACAPWSGILVDNIWHLMQLYCTARLVG